MTKHINFQLNDILDQDIIKFLEAQTNRTALFRKIIRDLIKEYGYVDLYREIGNRGDNKRLW